MRSLSLPLIFSKTKNLRLAAKVRWNNSKAAATTALIFDTETTGMMDRTKHISDQPELVQLGIILVDTVDWKKRLQVSLLVQQVSQSVDPQAFRVHGISDQHRQQYGVPLKTALSVLEAASAKADCLVAHNMSFDRHILQSSFYRAEKETRMWDDLPQICTMEECTPILRLPAKWGYKWPSLEESYNHFTKNRQGNEDETTGIENAHDALADAEACLVVLRGLIDSNVIDPMARLERAEVHQNVENPTTEKTAKVQNGTLTPAEPGELKLDLNADGCFVIHGNTFKHRVSLRALGGTWSTSKRAWIFTDKTMLEPARKFVGH